MLAGLIIATAEIDGENGLCAELPVAGQALIEHQARLVASAGADHIVVLVERLPAGLLAAIDRLKRDGLTVDIARSVEDAADRIHPDERLIVVADSLVADRATVDLMAGQSGVSVLVVPDTPENARWERIDANARWGGLAMLDGALLRRTAAMLGDWDLQSTLLRRAVQSGAVYVDAPAGKTPALLAIVEDRETAAAVDDALASRAAHVATGLPDRFIFTFIARLAAPHAMRAMVAPTWFRGGAVGLTLAGAACFAAGWLWAGLVALLLAGPVDSVGRHIAALSWRAPAEGQRWDRMRLAGSAVAVLLLGRLLADAGGGWGCWALAIVLIGLMAAIADHRRLFSGSPERPEWLAEPDGLIWLFLPFAMAGATTVGMGAMAAYAFASLLKTFRLAAGMRA